MSKLVICRGLPASGKSTRALEWVRADPTNRVRVNRDLYREMLHGGRTGTYEQEVQVTLARDATITAFLKKGISVVEDGTNLVQRHARELRKLATFAGAEFEIWDMTDVPLQVCIRRDAERSASVGEQVIKDMFNRFIRGKFYPLPFPEEPTADLDSFVPYEPDTSLPRAIILDIDGTAALNLSGRDIYDYSRVHEDSPNVPVIDTVKIMRDAGYTIVVLSGRTDDCLEMTATWLDTHIGKDYDGPYMRKSGDMRKDSIVKYELFNEWVRDRYNVQYCLDDRRQVTEMYRSLGLPVFQVAEGEF